MRCPYCSEHSDKVVDSRTAADGDAIRRRRECLACGRRYTTYERLEPIALVVRKRTGVVQPFNRDKLARGIAQATAGRAVMASKDSGGGGQERAAKTKEQADDVVDQTPTDVHERVEELTSDVDDLLDEIDDVLESNAEEFVKSYVQKGGQ